LWTSGNRYYFVASQKGVDRAETFVGKEQFETVSTSGGKFLLTNTASKSPSSTTLTAPIQPVPSSFPSSSVGTDVPH
jgi:hypothetical protein